MIQKFIPPILQALERASEKILEIYAKDFKIQIKEDNSPVTEADQASSDIILEVLSQFNIPIISEEEENPNFEDRKKEPYVWLVDPLDGTREFINKNDQFCICVALIKNGLPILGFIASPTQKTILFGGKQIGVFEIPFYTKEISDKKWEIKPPQINKTKILAHSNAPFSETSLTFVNQLEKQFGEINIIRKGSALKFLDLVNGQADFYIRLAPTMEWDIAAGQAIYEAVGGEVLNFYTKETLTYNKKQLKNPHFLAKLKTTKLEYNE